MRGFKEVIGLAVVIVGVYLVLNLLVIGSGWYIWSGIPNSSQPGIEIWRPAIGI